MTCKALFTQWNRKAVTAQQDHLIVTVIRDLHYIIPTGAFEGNEEYSVWQVMHNIKVVQKKNYHCCNTSVPFQVGQMVLVETCATVTEREVRRRRGGWIPIKWLTERNLYILQNKSCKLLQKAMNPCRLKNYHEQNAHHNVVTICNLHCHCCLIPQSRKSH